MKKISIFLISMVFFLGINTVSAEETSTSNIKEYNYVSYWVFSNDDYINASDVISHLYELNYEYYVSNYQEEYPYYNVYLFYNGENDIYSKLILFKDVVGFSVREDNHGIFIDTTTGSQYTIDNTLAISSEYHNGTYTLPSIVPNTIDMSNMLNSNYVERFNFYSNFDLINYSDYTIIINELDDDNIGFSVNPGEAFPTWQKLKNLNIISDPNSNDTSYVEINLNQYPYVALSLKDYTKRDTFYTNVYVKGNYCLTPVYNYGMTEKGEVLSGYKSQRCSTYYDNYTLVRTYILSQDIDNNAIYYLKAYDTSKDNLVKVDTSIFEITYITEETQENPYVSITDKLYPTIAYDKLTSSATKSEDEDYISGVSCQVGDFNCYNENNPENIFDEVFSSPLNFLKGIWSSITSIFDIIGEFISLLPETMQSFLYLSFMIAVILGLLKIIL